MTQLLNPLSGKRISVDPPKYIVFNGNATDVSNPEGKPQPPLPNHNVDLSSPANGRYVFDNLSQQQIAALTATGYRIVKDDAVYRIPSPEERRTQFSDSVPQSPGDIQVLTQQSASVHGAKRLQEEVKLTGQGTIIHVIDTGLAKDVIKKVFSDENGNSRVIFFNDAFTAAPTDAPKDGDGHGTHCTGTAAGRNLEGRYNGMAPGAKIAATRVLDDDGYGSDASILVGIDDAVKLATENPETPVIVNMSLGGEVEHFPSELTRAIDAATKKGVIFCIAAGNSGRWGQGTIADPAICDSDTTVAALQFGRGGKDDFKVAAFSSKGVPKNTVDRYSMYNEPTLAAKGVDVRSVVPGNRYESWDGTSMATPAVAGCYALLFDALKRFSDVGWLGRETKNGWETLTWQQFRDLKLHVKLFEDTATKKEGIEPLALGAGKMNADIAVDKLVVTYINFNASNDKSLAYLAENAAEDWALESDDLAAETILNTAKTLIPDSILSADPQRAISYAAQFVAQIHYGPEGDSFRGKALGDAQILKEAMRAFYETSWNATKQVSSGLEFDFGVVLQAARKEMRKLKGEDKTLANGVKAVAARAAKMSAQELVDRYGRKNNGKAVRNVKQLSREDAIDAFGQPLNDVPGLYFAGSGQAPWGSRKHSDVSAQVVLNGMRTLEPKAQFSPVMQTDYDGVLQALEELDVDDATRAKLTAFLDIDVQTDDRKLFKKRSMYVARFDTGDEKGLWLTTVRTGLLSGGKTKMLALTGLPEVIESQLIQYAQSLHQ